MAELTENLRLQSLRFIVRHSPTEDEDDEFGDFRMEDDPYPHLYDATRLLLERCPELRHLYLQSGKFENVSEEELSSMVLRNCPQLDTFVYDNHQKTSVRIYRFRRRAEIPKYVRYHEEQIGQWICIDIAAFA